MSISDLILTGYWRSGLHYESAMPRVEIAYDANQNAEYIGVTEKGFGTSDSNWVIVKFTYNSNQDVTSRTTATMVAWDDRLSATYS